jgi:hypothetical protein
MGNAGQGCECLRYPCRVDQTAVQPSPKLSPHDVLHYLLFHPIRVLVKRALKR